MKCDRCGQDVEQGEEREHLGQTLCEDCYMDTLSPVRSCDPWAVHSAKSFEQHMGSHIALSPTQKQILHILEETGGLERDELLEKMKDRIDQPQLDRDFATLRHMEKVRAEKRDGKIILRLW